MVAPKSKKRAKLEQRPAKTLDHFFKLKQADTRGHAEHSPVSSDVSKSDTPAPHDMRVDSTVDTPRACLEQVRHARPSVAVETAAGNRPKVLRRPPARDDTETPAWKAVRVSTDSEAASDEGPSKLDRAMECERAGEADGSAASGPGNRKIETMELELSDVDAELEESLQDSRLDFRNTKDAQTMPKSKDRPPRRSPRLQRISDTEDVDEEESILADLLRVESRKKKPKLRISDIVKQRNIQKTVKAEIEESMQRTRALGDSLGTDSSQSHADEMEMRNVMEEAEAILRREPFDEDQLKMESRVVFFSRVQNKPSFSQVRDTFLLDSEGSDHPVSAGSLPDLSSDRPQKGPQGKLWPAGGDVMGWVSLAKPLTHSPRNRTRVQKAVTYFRNVLEELPESNWDNGSWIPSPRMMSLLVRRRPCPAAVGTFLFQICAYGLVEGSQAAGVRAYRCLLACVAGAEGRLSPRGSGSNPGKERRYIAKCEPFLSLEDLALVIENHGGRVRAARDEPRIELFESDSQDGLQCSDVYDMSQNLPMVIDVLCQCCSQMLFTCENSTRTEQAATMIEMCSRMLACPVGQGILGGLPAKAINELLQWFPDSEWEQWCGFLVDKMKDLSSIRDQQKELLSSLYCASSARLKQLRSNLSLALLRRWRLGPSEATEDAPVVYLAQDDILHQMVKLTLEVAPTSHREEDFRWIASVVFFVKHCGVEHIGSQYRPALFRKLREIKSSLARFSAPSAFQAKMMVSMLITVLELFKKRHQDVQPTIESTAPGLGAVTSIWNPTTR